MIMDTLTRFVTLLKNYDTWVQVLIPFLLAIIVILLIVKYPALTPRIGKGDLQVQTPPEIHNEPDLAWLVPFVFYWEQQALTEGAASTTGLVTFTVGDPTDAFELTLPFNSAAKELYQVQGYQALFSIKKLKKKTTEVVSFVIFDREGDVTARIPECVQGDSVIALICVRSKGL